MTFDLIKYLTENSIPYSVSRHGSIDIPGNLNLADKKNVVTLPDNLTVGGSVYLRGTQITTLPEYLTVGRDLNLSGIQITTLPASLRVGSCIELTTLPENLIVDDRFVISISGNLDLVDYENVTTLPRNLWVGGWFDLRGAQITTLPDSLIVNGWVDLRDTQITMLPKEELRVGSWLNLSGSQITTLPEYLDLVVDGYLCLTDTQITKLPSYLTCGSLYLDPEHFSNVTFRKNCGDSNRTIFAVMSGERFYIAAGSFYGPVVQFEDAVDRKYSGEAAEAYKQAARDCVDELKDKLSSNQYSL
ncbi:hypothetical protein D8682_06705 [Buttiauxella sp. 3AFRM03]|uniref:hypothetical protein n=1 Tax=Buttiauxella sp. 3AFRM03 TaxID=2479367 RepID=UPI000EF75C6D|nr:hypothetical protein [Buttiauxella sp. 3AFRM03]AYN26704.1 hypothetical protein D8682_06705 [Buttiauxella sp. 3AFRM03]